MRRLPAHVLHAALLLTWTARADDDANGVSPVLLVQTHIDVISAEGRIGKERSRALDAGNEESGPQQNGSFPPFADSRPGLARRRPAKEAAGGEAPEADSAHAVQHAKVLNKVGLWVLMGTMIFAIAVMVIRMDASMSSRDSVVLTAMDKEEETWAQTALHLIFCVVALNAAMLFWGIAQEYMMTSLYYDDQGNAEKIPNSMCLVFFNRVVAALLSAVFIALHGKPFRFPGIWLSGLPAASNLMASWCQYQSLAYVSFPLQTATKSAKLLPVLVMNSLRGKPQTLLDYAEALVIVSSIVVFGFETDGADADIHARRFGIPLLLGLLLFDSVTPHFQDALFKKYPEMNTIQLTFSMSTLSSVLMLIAMLVTGSLVPSMRFFKNHPEAILQAFVLSLCSSLTQILISYTIKQFGPVVFALIATTRQVISVCISAILFMHHISFLAWLAASLVFGTVLTRMVRLRYQEESSAAVPETAPPSGLPHQGSFMEVMRNTSKFWRLAVCFVGINAPLGFYSVAQEFLATHTFQGSQFRYPMFLIAANRTGASLFALIVLKVQGIHIFNPKILYTILPAAANFLATFCQYQALYYLRYPAQTLMKSMKVLPVMLCGRLLKNRNYTYFDYAEAALITALVCFFTWNFNHDKATLSENKGILPGILLMLGYVVSDSFTSNSEDLIFQRAHLDPGQMLLGMQACSGVVGWSAMLIDGHFLPAVRFLLAHREACLIVAILVMAEACGAYACTVTVRLFGPAVFTLLLMSHQLISLLVSVALFNHEVSWPSCLCLAVVALVVLTSSLRRVTAKQETPASKVA